MHARPLPCPLAVPVALGVAVTLGALVALGSRPAHGQAPPEGTDYAVSSEAWNGLGDFVTLAGGVGLTVESRASLDWDELGDGDVLVILYPERRLEPTHVAAFLRRGGRLLLADDFGEARETLAKLGLLRRKADPAGARLHEGNPALPVARPALTSHPLAQGVDELVTNHPSVFSVEGGAESVFVLPAGGAVVVAGSLGEGRFVALADPSLLINAMLAFEGNLTFAANVLTFLAPGGGERGGRVVVLSGTFDLTGAPPATLEDERRAANANEFLGDFAKFLDEFNDYLATERALRGLGVALALALVVAGAFALVPHLRRRPPDGAWTRLVVAPAPMSLERLLGDVARHPERASYLHAAALLRRGLEERLATLLGVPTLASTSRTALVAAVERRAGRPAAERLAALLPRLALVPLPSDLHAAERHLGRRAFERLHDDVRALEDLLHEAASTAGPRALADAPAALR